MHGGGAGASHRICGPLSFIDGLALTRYTCIYAYMYTIYIKLLPGVTGQYGI